MIRVPSTVPSKPLLSMACSRQIINIDASMKNASSDRGLVSRIGIRSDTIFKIGESEGEPGRRIPALKGVKRRNKGLF